MFYVAKTKKYKIFGRRVDRGAFSEMRDACTKRSVFIRFAGFLDQYDSYSRGSLRRGSLERSTGSTQPDISMQYLIQDVLLEERSTTKRQRARKTLYNGEVKRTFEDV